MSDRWTHHGNDNNGFGKRDARRLEQQVNGGGLLDFTDSEKEDEGEISDESTQSDKLHQRENDEQMAQLQIAAPHEDEEDKHKLSPKWVFWLWVGDRTKEWTDCLRQQCTITSIEDYIALKHRILPPSRLPCDPTHIVNYMFFKEGIKPMWEDPCNCRGGTIDVTIARTHQFTRLDRLWFEMLVTTFGAQFGDQNNQICGVVLRFRARGYAISLWIRNASDANVYAPIISTLEDKLGIGNDRCVQISISKHPVQTSVGERGGGGSVRGSNNTGRRF